MDGKPRKTRSAILKPTLVFSVLNYVHGRQVFSVFEKLQFIKNLLR